MRQASSLPRNFATGPRKRARRARPNKSTPFSGPFLCPSPWQVPYDVVSGDLRADLERKGQVTGGNDLLIAAHAVALDAKLVTDDTRKFAHIKSLSYETWL